MRAHLLTTAAAVGLLAATSAQAQDATWLLNPGSGSFNTATNWNPAAVPTNTAIFGASNTTSILFQPFATTSIATLQFNSDAPAYIFATSAPLFTSISITGAGIVNNSSNAPTFIVGNQGSVFFSQWEHRRQRHHNHQRRWAHRIRGQRQRRECTLHHPRRRRIRHNLPVEWRDDGRLDRGRGNFLSGLKPAHRRQQQSLDHVSGVITGTGGALVKVGSGTLTLDGSNSYTGATVVAGGTLAVTGDISSSSGVLVTPGAMLSGTGTVPGVLVAGGTLMPGQSVGTLNVRGSLVFTSAATYLININATTASLTNVTGTAVLNGATVQVVDDRDITKRQVYTLLTATGGISGTFNPDIVGVKNKVELFYDANNVYLCDHCKFSDLFSFG